jgi:hypothetical protein
VSGNIITVSDKRAARAAMASAGKGNVKIGTIFPIFWTAFDRIFNGTYFFSLENTSPNAKGSSGVGPGPKPASPGGQGL